MQTWKPPWIISCLKQSSETAGTPLAFCNGWRWGAPIRPGQVTRNDLCNIIPWTEPISTVELTGRELLEMLEENLERTFSADPFPSIGRLREALSRVDSLHQNRESAWHAHTEALRRGQEVQPDQTYSRGISDRAGGPAKFGQNRKTLSADAHDAMLTVLTKRKDVKADLEGTVLVN